MAFNYQTHSTCRRAINSLRPSCNGKIVLRRLKMCVVWCNKSELNYLYGGDQVNAVFQAIWFCYCFFPRNRNYFGPLNKCDAVVAAEIEILIGESACGTSSGARYACQSNWKMPAAALKSSKILYIVNILIAFVCNRIPFRCQCDNRALSHCTVFMTIRVLTISYCNSWQRAKDRPSMHEILNDSAWQPLNCMVNSTIADVRKIVIENGKQTKRRKWMFWWRCNIWMCRPLTNNGSRSNTLH